MRSMGHLTCGVELMRLPLNALLLRRGMLPVNSLSIAAQEHATFWTRSGTGLQRLDALDYELLDASIPGDIVVALIQRNAIIPAWQRFVQDALSLADFGTPSASLGAVIFDAVDYRDMTRWLAWTFGSGSRALRRSATDPRFGLLVALNALVTGQLSDVDDGGGGPRPRGVKLSDLRYRTRGPYTHQTGHRSARGVPIRGFRMDTQSDLLSAVGGRTTDPILADVFGGRSARFRTEVTTLADLQQLSSGLVQRSTDDAYRAEFAWVDNVALVEDEGLITDLRHELVQQLLMEPAPSTVDVVLPDDLLDLDDERSIQYILPPKRWRRAAESTTLTIPMIAFLLRKHGAGREIHGLEDELRFLDASKAMIGSQTILVCLSAELTLAGAHYIAYDGDFYRVDPDFVRAIDAEVSAIQRSDCSLPCYDGRDEGTYNKKIRDSGSDRFVVLDRALIHLPNQSGVEACDIMAKTGAMIHVKRKGKSSTLSHLFLQAVNSCELLTGSTDARAQWRRMIEASSSNSSVKGDVLAQVDRLEKGERGLQVVFAILGDWRGKTVCNLPFFSRLSLLQASRRINQLAYIPSIELVNVCL
jgi:uncharacterized protein (TIGR04141 family)